MREEKDLMTKNDAKDDNGGSQGIPTTRKIERGRNKEGKEAKR